MKQAAEAADGIKVPRICFDYFFMGQADESLDAAKVAEAMQKELDSIKKKGGWVQTPRREAHEDGWKIVKTLWIDINKEMTKTQRIEAGL